MAEAAKPSTSAASKVFPTTREQSDFACGICCKQVTEQRILSCRHYFCAECIDSIRSTADVPACPYCRERISTPAIGYPRILKDDEPQEDIKKEITCEIHHQIEGDCKRSVDFYCQPCKMFICYRCRKSSKCALSEGFHAAVEISDLLPLAKEMFADWQKKKQDEIEKLHSEITQLTDNIKELVVSDNNNTRGNSQEMVQLTQQLHYLTVQKAGELAPLEYYGGNIDKISEIDLIQLVQHMATDQPSRRKETADQYINNIRMSKGSSSVEENIVKLKRLASDQPEKPVAGNEKSVPETSNSSSAIKKVIPKDDYDCALGSRGYLPNQVEVHKNRTCAYYYRGESGDKGVILMRSCHCSVYEYGAQELHYKRACQWKRITNNGNSLLYLVRSCCCQPPERKKLATS